MAAASTSTHVHQWEHHEACLFAIPGTGWIDPSGVGLPVIEKIKEFHYNPAHGSFATLICEGTHHAESAQALRQSLMIPGIQWNLFICRYDAHPNFTANGSQFFVRHTVHNLRVRVCDFREKQTLITIDHETGRTEVKKVMHIVFDDVGPMESIPSTLTTESTSLSTISSLSTFSASTIVSTTAWTPLSTLSIAHVSTLSGTS